MLHKNEEMRLKKIITATLNTSKMLGFTSVGVDQIRLLRNMSTSVDSWTGVACKFNTSILTTDVIPCVLNLLQLLALHSSTTKSRSMISYLLDQLRSRSAKALWMLNSSFDMCDFMICQKMLMQALLHLSSQVNENQ